MKKPFVEFVKDELKSKFLLITCGLPGTWKTETSEEVSRLTGCPILRSDLIRLEVLEKEDVFDEKVASNMDKRLMVYDELFQKADQELTQGNGVILDATFITQSLRKRAAQLAAKHHRPMVIMQTSCPREVSLERILRRTKENYESNALTEQAYINNEEKFEKVNLEELKGGQPGPEILHFVVDTRRDQVDDWYITHKAKEVTVRRFI